MPSGPYGTVVLTNDYALAVAVASFSEGPPGAKDHAVDRSLME